MKRTHASLMVKLFLAAFFIAAVLLPLGAMLVRIRPSDIAHLTGSPQFLQAIQNSLLASLVASALSIVIAYLLAVCLTRTDIPCKGLIATLVVLPMLIPSISHGMGLVVLFGTNGVLTNLLGLQSSIYGFWGIVTGSVMYAFPVAFLMLSDVMRYEDCTVYDAASVLGIPRWKQFFAITLPYLRKPLIAVVFSTFTLIVTDYGVPLMIGGKCITLPVLMYQEVVGLLHFGKGSVIGALLLLPAVAAFLVDTLNTDKGNASFGSQPFTIRKNSLRDAAACLYSAAISVMVLLPLAAFAVLAFSQKYPHNMRFTLTHVVDTMRASGWSYLGNSICIALMVALCGMALSFVTAYLTARMPTVFSRYLHLFSTVSLAVPGIVLGLSYVLLYNGSALYGTLAILILVNLVHFFSSPYLILYNSMGKMNRDLESVGLTLGVSRLRVIRDVILPQTLGSLWEVGSYFFINSMMTISAVSFLASVATKPIALLITQFEAQMQLERAAFVALLILTVNLIMKGSVKLLKRRFAHLDA